VDTARTFITVQEPNRDHLGNERAVVALPIDGKFNILIRQARQVTIATVGRSPQEQVHAAQRAGVPKPAAQLLCFGV